MKKLVLGLLSLFLVMGTITAQDGKKDLKKASKLLLDYGKNAAANEGKLSEGLDLLESASKSQDVMSDAKSLIMAGQAYNSIVSGQINTKLIDPSFNISNPEGAFKASEMLLKGYELAEKKGDKKKALLALNETENVLNNVAINFFQAKEYGKAFDYFQKGVDLYNAAKGFDGFTSRLSDDSVRSDHYFYTGASGYYGQKGLAAAPVLEELASNITADGEPLVMEALYNIYSATDKDKAIGFLEKGRQIFPDDTGILFAEINRYLEEGKLDVLIEKLKIAQEKEPDNISIITTLGNVNDQLSQKYNEEGNEAESSKYFDGALKYYGMALEKDPKNFDAQYSLGALYYNKAASLTAPINDLANDFSADGTKKYEAMKSKMDGLFNEAKPFFEKAEKLSPNDLNTLIALREIAARSNDFEKVAEYKARVEALQTGGGN